MQYPWRKVYHAYYFDKDVLSSCIYPNSARIPIHILISAFTVGLARIVVLNEFNPKYFKFEICPNLSISQIISFRHFHLGVSIREGAPHGVYPVSSRVLQQHYSPTFFLSYILLFFIFIFLFVLFFEVKLSSRPSIIALISHISHLIFYLLPGTSPEVELS